MTISLFRGGITNTDAPEYLDPADLVPLIRDGYAEETQRLRWLRWEDGDEKKASAVKKRLDYVCLAGRFDRRDAGHLVEPSGLFPCDVDNLETLEIAEQLRDEMSGDPHIALAYVSPSGRGVKFAVRVPPETATAENGRILWGSANRYTLATYGYPLDPSGKDISRAAFLGHDIGAWWNADTVPLEITAPDEAERLGDSVDPGADEIAPGSRHDDLVRIAGSLAARGFNRTEIINLLQGRVETRYQGGDGRTFDETEIANAVDSGIRKYAPESGGEAAVRVYCWDERRAEREWKDPGPIPAGVYGGLCGVGREWWDWLIDTSLYPQHDLALGAILCATGTLVGRRWAGPWGTRANLYGLGVAGTGEGKEASRRGISRLFTAAGAAEWLGSQDPKSDSAIINGLADHPEQIMCIDEAGYLFAAMASSKSGSHVRNIMKTLLQLYTSSAETFTASSYADRRQNTVLHEPHLCCWLTTTPGKLWASLGSEALDGGLLGRSLVFIGPPEKPEANTPPPDTSPPAGLVETVGQAYKHRDMRGDLTRIGASGCQPMPVDADAMAELMERRDAVDHHQRRHAGDPAAALWARITEQAIKVAMVRAWWADPLGPEIDRDCIRFGFALVEHCMARMASHAGLFGGDDDSPFGRARQRALALLRAAPDGLTRTQIMRSLRVKASLLSETLESLEQSGEIGRRKGGDLTGGVDRWVVV